MGHPKSTRYGALAVLATVVMMLMAVAIPATAGPGGNDRPKSQPTDPDPEPSPSRSADRPGECYDNPNNSGGGGANRSGDYDSSCDKSAGDHGSGGNGKCAGCDGKSDFKNPKGQYKNDHNNGYECDHNGGVGKGNPAHSRCVRPTTTTPCPEGGCPPPDCPPGGCPPPDCPPGHPDCTPNCPPGQPGCSPPDFVLPNIVEPCDANPDMEGLQLCVEDDVLGGDIRGDRSETLPSRVPRGRVLPFTGAGGAGVGVLLLAALGLFGAGTLLIKRR